MEVCMEDYTGTTENATVVHVCNMDFVPTSRVTSVCNSEAVWDPVPEQHECIGESIILITKASDHIATHLWESKGATDTSGSDTVVADWINNCYKQTLAEQPPSWLNTIFACNNIAVTKLLELCSQLWSHNVRSL